MPKGADLHNHLSGAVYAESWIRAGAEDNLCVNTATLTFAKSEGSADSKSKSVPTQPVCGEGKVPAAQAYKVELMNGQSTETALRAEYLG